MTIASSPRFGVWANVYGTWASLQHPDDPLDASWERNKRQIHTFHAQGTELFMLQFQPFEAEMQRFAEKVAPLVRGAAPARIAS